MVRRIYSKEICRKIEDSRQANAADEMARLGAKCILVCHFSKMLSIHHYELLVLQPSAKRKHNILHQKVLLQEIENV